MNGVAFTEIAQEEENLIVEEQFGSRHKLFDGQVRWEVWDIQQETEYAD